MENKGIWSQIRRGRKIVYSPSGNITIGQIEEVMSYLGIEVTYGPHPTQNYYDLRSPYRIPTFEELREGMEVEILTSYGWKKDTWPEVLGADTHVNLFGGNTLLDKFKYADLRIKKQADEQNK
jgi:hypothetical protein